HNLRYTREKGKSKMEDKVGLTLACLNLKKLVKMRAGKPFYFVQIVKILAKRRGFRLKKEKDKRLISVCLHSETTLRSFVFIPYQRLS
ncbi:IS5/IS1182 family transposase, partial [Streptococcus suis]